MLARNKKAFTLVELLVVIAVISILAGLLLPALEDALRSAREIHCLNNLKQIGLSWNAYMQDNNGRIFDTYRYISPETHNGRQIWINWPNAVAPYLGIVHNQWSNYSTYITQHAGEEFACPLWQDAHLDGDDLPTWTYAIRTFYGYPWQYWASHNGNAMKSSKPSRCPLALGTSNYHFAVSYSTSTKGSYIGQLYSAHGGDVVYDAGNYPDQMSRIEGLFLDGHASMEAESDWPHNSWADTNSWPF